MKIEEAAAQVAAENRESFKKYEEIFNMIEASNLEQVEKDELFAKLETVYDREDFASHKERKEAYEEIKKSLSTALKEKGSEYSREEENFSKKVDETKKIADLKDLVKTKKVIHGSSEDFTAEQILDFMGAVERALGGRDYEVLPQNEKGLVNSLLYRITNQHKIRDTFERFIKKPKNTEKEPTLRDKLIERYPDHVDFFAADEAARSSLFDKDGNSIKFRGIKDEKIYIYFGEEKKTRWLTDIDSLEPLLGKFAYKENPKEKKGPGKGAKEKIDIMNKLKARYSDLFEKFFKPYKSKRAKRFNAEGNYIKYQEIRNGKIIIFFSAPEKKNEREEEIDINNLDRLDDILQKEFTLEDDPKKATSDPIAEAEKLLIEGLYIDEEDLDEWVRKKTDEFEGKLKKSGLAEKDIVEQSEIFKKHLTEMANPVSGLEAASKFPSYEEFESKYPMFRIYKNKDTGEHFSILDYHQNEGKVILKGILAGEKEEREYALPFDKFLAVWNRFDTNIIEPQGLEGESVQTIQPELNELTSEQSAEMERLMKLVGENRDIYAEKDYKAGSVLNRLRNSAIGKFLKMDSSKVPDVSESYKKYQESLDELKNFKIENLKAKQFLNAEEIENEMRDLVKFFVLDEKFNLYDARSDARIRVMEQKLVEEGSEKRISLGWVRDKYRSLQTWQRNNRLKWIAGSVGMTLLGMGIPKRILGGIMAGTGIASLAKNVQRGFESRSFKNKNENIFAGDEEKSLEEKFEIINQRIKSENGKLDEKLAREKWAESFRASAGITLAILVGDGTVGHLMHDALHYFGMDEMIGKGWQYLKDQGYKVAEHFGYHHEIPAGGGSKMIHGKVPEGRIKPIQPVSPEPNRVGKIAPPAEAPRPVTPPVETPKAPGSAPGQPELPKDWKPLVGETAKTGPVATPPIEKNMVSNVVEIKKGDSAWKIINEQLDGRYAEEYAKLNPAQKTYVIDALKDKVAAHPHEYGLKSADRIMAGQKMEAGKLFADQSKVDKIFGDAKGLNQNAQDNILKNNKSIVDWLEKHPGKTLDTKQVNEILNPKPVVLAEMHTSRPVSGHVEARGNHSVFESKPPLHHGARSNSLIFADENPRHPEVPAHETTAGNRHSTPPPPRNFEEVIQPESGRPSVISGETFTQAAAESSAGKTAGAAAVGGVAMGATRRVGGNKETAGGGESKVSQAKNNVIEFPNAKERIKRKAAKEKQNTGGGGVGEKNIKFARAKDKSIREKARENSFEKLAKKYKFGSQDNFELRAVKIMNSISGGKKENWKAMKDIEARAINRKDNPLNHILTSNVKDLEKHLVEIFGRAARPEKGETVMKWIGRITGDLLGFGREKMQKAA